jgi:O-acetylhomoserine (thiol)-lyase
VPADAAARSARRSLRGPTVKRVRDETIAVHGGYEPGSTRAVAVPIYQTVAHDFESAAHAGAVFDLELPGFHYNRINNPTVDVLERRMAELELGTAAVALSSGAAAVRQSVRNVTDVGSNIVTAPQLYGATYTYFAHVLPGEGVEVRFAADDRAGSIEPLIDDNTRAVFCESIGNPACNVVDIEAVADVAHRHGVPLIVDNTVATPLTLKPIAHGADVVVHSLTKFVGGHGTTLGGMVIDSGSFPWSEHATRFPMFSRPEPAFHGVVYTRDFPGTAYAVRCRTVGLRNEGPTLAPLNAFLLLQGLETLSVRLERHRQNALQVAEYLAQDSRVGWVGYLGFIDHPHHDLAKRYLAGRYPSIVTFGASGGRDASIRFFDHVKLIKRLVNMGDAKSLVAHPASTTHRQLDSAALAQVGISPEMIRLSVGIEHIDDIIEDIDQALGA